MRFYAVYHVVLDAPDIDAANEATRTLDHVLGKTAPHLDLGDFRARVVEVNQDGSAMTEESFESAHPAGGPE